MKQRELMSRYLKAQFTVEAALLMVIILPVLICILFAGFYLHDRTYVNGACLETASAIINMKNAGKEDSKAGQVFRDKLRTGTLWLNNTSGSVSIEEESAAAHASGSFAAFPMGQPAGAFLSGQIDGSAEAQNQNPAQVIRKIKGARYLVDEILSAESP